MDAIVEEFNRQHPDIRVNSTLLEWGEYYTKLMTGIATGNAPDVAVAHTARIPELVEEGLLQPLDNLADLARVDWNTFNQTILDATVVDGQHYAVPIDTHPIVFYYNKAYVREAGLLDENDNLILENTPEGFVRFLATLQESLPDNVFTASIPTGGDDPYRIWWSFYRQMDGSPMFSDDLRQITLDKDKAIRAAEYMLDMYYKYEFIPLHLQDTYESFQNGRAATIITGVWATGIWEITEGLEFGVIPFPQVFGQPGQWADSHTLVLPYQRRADQAKMEAAITFADFVASNGDLWARAGHVPSKVTVLDKPEFQALPYRSDYAASADFAEYDAWGPKAGAVRAAAIRNLDTIWAKTSTPEQAIDNMIAEIRAIR
ncbi:MAG: extracellular solute-binding protein [Firmicutes bacterium]|nr:extracellular solute-binding protein [Bacillota bacterium]